MYLYLNCRSFSRVFFLGGVGGWVGGGECHLSFSCLRSLADNAQEQSIWSASNLHGEAVRSLQISPSAVGLGLQTGWRRLFRSRSGCIRHRSDLSQ